MGLIVNILLISVAVFILIRWFFEPPRPQIHFLMVGLEGAGKSSLLVKSEVGQVITSTLVSGMCRRHAEHQFDVPILVHLRHFALCSSRFLLSFFHSDDEQSVAFNKGVPRREP